MGEIDFAATAGVTYYFAVDGEDASIGTASLTLTDLGGGGGELPAGAVGVFDFAGGTYLWGATDYTAADVIDHPEYVVPGIGLYAQDYELVGSFEDLPPVNILAGPFLDHLLTGDFTVVIEWYSDGLCGVLRMNNAGNTAAEVLIQSRAGDNLLAYDLDEAREVAIGTDIEPHGVIAFTRTDTGIAFRISFSDHVATLFSDTGSAAAIAAVDAELAGHDSLIYDSALIRRIVFYPALDNSELAALVVKELTAPENDNFADAIAIAVGESITGHNFLATAEAGEPEHGGNSGQRSVWYKHAAAATASRTVTVSSIGDFNGQGPALAVYTGSDVASLSEVDSILDWPNASITFSASSGTTYYFAVDSAFAPGSGPFTIELT